MSSYPSLEDLLGLCKLKVVSLILLTAIVGMLLAVPYFPSLFVIFFASVGTVSYTHLTLPTIYSV